MHPRNTFLKLVVIALIVSATVFVFPATQGGTPVYSAQIAPSLLDRPAQQSTVPDIVCPSGYSLTATFERFPPPLLNALVFGIHDFDEYNVALGDVNATLVVWSVVGHPELGCTDDDGGDPLCSDPDQLNEHFNILVNGGQVAYIGDPGDHGWYQHPDVNLGLLGAGNYTFRFEHAGNPDPSNAANPSVGYKVGLCTQVPPPPPGDQGCTPGYWKNHLTAWAGFDPNQTLGSVFDVPDSLGIDNDSLLTALNYGGGPGALGGAQILLRAAVASLLNAASGSVSFPLTVADVIAQTNAAFQTNAALASLNRATMLNLASYLDGLNNLGCPLN